LDGEQTMPWLAQAATEEKDDRERISIPIEPMKHIKKRTILKDAAHYWTNEGAPPRRFPNTASGPRDALGSGGRRRTKKERSRHLVRRICASSAVASPVIDRDETP
jgi:hypothetical protein